MLKDGDIVRLSSGGPNMTVCMTDQNRKGVVCAGWFDGGELRRDSFEESELVLVASGPDITVVAHQIQRLHKLDGDLRAFVAKPDQPDQLFSMGVEEARLLIAEVDRLRGIAGAVSQGPSFADMRRVASVPPHSYRVGADGVIIDTGRTEATPGTEH